jgi:hypothetical protein
MPLDSNFIVWIWDVKLPALDVTPEKLVQERKL